MRKLAGFLGMTLGGAVGWWAGNTVGIMSAVIVSAIGSGVGLYYARRVMDEYLP